MLFSLKVKLSGLPLQDLDAKKFHLFPMVLFCNGFGTQLLGQVSQATSCVWHNLLALDS